MPGTFQNLHLTLDNVVLATAAAQPVLSSNGPGAIVIKQVYLRPDGTADGFLTVSTNTASRCYVVQATTDLQSWINVSTNEASDDLLLFLDTGAAGHPYRFYRAVFCDATGVPAAALATLRQLPQGGMEIQFQSGSGRSYHLQSSTNLLDWVELTTLTGTGLPLSYLDHRSTSTPQRFYRIRVE